MSEDKPRCPACRSRAYVYVGRANAEFGEYWEKNGKHEFKCTSCGHRWQYGTGDSHYLRNAMVI